MPKIFYAVCLVQFFLFIPAAAAKRRTGRLRTGSSSAQGAGFQSAIGGSLRSALLIISGEADETRRARLESEWKDRDVRFAKNLPLPQLAALLENSIFVGHDSGISHLAAAAGAKCILLFGPTDPDVWAPMNENVEVLRAPGGDLRRLDVDLVRRALRL